MKKFILSLLLLFVLLTSCTTTTNPGTGSNNNVNNNNTNNNVGNNNNTNTNTNPNEPQNPEEDEETVNNYGNILDYISDEGDVPLIRINTADRVFPTDKENYVDGTLEIVEQPNKENILFESADMGIRLRGNSTLECPKKAYRIKFDKKQSLFDLPAAKSWVLLANYYDKSNLRNYLAYLTANKLSNLDFQPSSIFVEVEFNGVDMGLYILCEQMQTGEGRVDIEQDEFDESNGSYFFELDFEDRIKQDGLVKNISYFESYGSFYALKYPEDDEATYKRCLYIKSFMDSVNLKIRNKTDYENIMDVGSFIDYYLIQELFKNVDGIQSSVYYYVENKKLYAGPVWDFDLGLSVVGYNSVDGCYNHYVTSNYWIKENHPIYKELFKDSRFVTLVQERYTEVREILFEVFREIDLVLEYLTDELENNERIWSIPGYRHTWVAERFSYEYADIKNTFDHITFVRKELTKQFYYLDEAYLLY